jgi:hypothetical protein
MQNTNSSSRGMRKPQSSSNYSKSPSSRDGGSSSRPMSRRSPAAGGAFTGTARRGGSSTSSGGFSKPAFADRKSASRPSYGNSLRGGASSHSSSNSSAPSRSYGGGGSSSSYRGGGSSYSKRPSSGGNAFGGRNRGRGGSSSGGGGRSAGKGRGERIDASRFINKVVSVEVEEVFKPRHQFTDFLIEPKLKEAIIGKGYVTPTPIQDEAIPKVLEGRDIVGIANTGTGKTAAFLIPLINKVLKNPNEQTIIIVPTRELAIQIEDELRGFTKSMKIFSVVA